MYVEGYTRILNVDFALPAIEAMQERLAGQNFDKTFQCNWGKKIFGNIIIIFLKINGLM